MSGLNVRFTRKRTRLGDLGVRDLVRESGSLAARSKKPTRQMPRTRSPPSGPRADRHLIDKPARRACRTRGAQSTPRGGHYSSRSRKSKRSSCGFWRAGGVGPRWGRRGTADQLNQCLAMPHDRRLPQAAVELAGHRGHIIWDLGHGRFP